MLPFVIDGSGRTVLVLPDYLDELGQDIS